MTDGDAAKVKAHAAVCLSACKSNFPLRRSPFQQLKAAAPYPSPPSSPCISSCTSTSTISSSISPSHSPPGPLRRSRCQQLKATAPYPSPPSSPSISSSCTSPSIPSTYSSTRSHSPSPSPPPQYQLMEQPEESPGPPEHFHLRQQEQQQQQQGEAPMGPLLPTIDQITAELLEELERQEPNVAPHPNQPIRTSFNLIARDELEPLCQFDIVVNRNNLNYVSTLFMVLSRYYPMNHGIIQGAAVRQGQLA